MFFFTLFAEHLREHRFYTVCSQRLSVSEWVCKETYMLGNLISRVLRDVYIFRVPVFFPLRLYNRQGPLQIWVEAALSDHHVPRCCIEIVGDVGLSVSGL